MLMICTGIWRVLESCLSWFSTVHGYPSLHYARGCAPASKLVHVCDVFDALSTTRPYRAAWPIEDTLAYLEVRAGTEFDADLVAAFVKTIREGRAQIKVLVEDRGTGEQGETA